MTIPALFFGLVIASLASALYALPGLFAITKEALEACQTLLERCVELAVTAKLVFFWSGALLVSGGLVYASFRAAKNILAAKRALSSMPIKRGKGSISLIMDPSIKAAFTCGLMRPRIYMSTGLLRALEKDELRAVFLHELKHKRGFDPLRFLVMGFLRDAFFYLPAIRHLSYFSRLRKEHEADDAAVSSLGEPLSLASAMVKVAKEGSLYAALADDAGQVTGRVRRLLEGREERARMPAKALAVSLTLSAALLLSLSMPIYAALPAHECTLDKCEKHHKVVKDCKRHCATREVHHQGHHH